MDVLNDRIIDVGLNVIGFIAVGLFWVVVYTAITKSRKAPTVCGAPEKSVIGNDVQASVPDRAAAEKQKLEFINFNSMPVKSGSGSTVSSPAGSANRASTRRNRVEIIRMAREMIEKGVTDEKIRSALPISDGELTLLSRGNRR